MGYPFTPQELKEFTPESIEKYRKFVLDHPIDHSYDEECEMFDGKVPLEQLMSREYSDLLEALNEIDKTEN